MTNRNIDGNEASQNTILHFPTEEACDAFGISRTSFAKASKTNPEAIGFLQGSQFKTNIFANDAKAGRPTDPFSVFDNSQDPQNSKLEKNILDEICLEFIGNAPTTVQQRTQNGLVLTSMDEKRPKEPYLILNVAPNSTEWLSFSHDHTWESGGGVLQKILEGLSELAQTASDFGTLLENVGGREDSNYAAKKITKTDFTATYKGSSPTQFTIPFTLFTPGGEIQDFIRDIHYPIMLMNFLSYPKRLKTLTPEELDQSIKAQDGQNSEVKSGANNKGIGESTSDTIDEAIRAGQEFVNQNIPGSRLAILEPPSYIRVTHSSGLFRLPACAITNFSYNYKGPWINMNKDVAKMPEYSAFTSDSTFMSRGFPCIAECSLTLQTVDPLYADDWANMFNTSDIVVLSSDKSSEGAIETSRRNTAEADKNYIDQIQNSKFGSGIRFASNVGVNIGFRGSL